MSASNPSLAIPGLRLGEKLGGGAFGSVYRARHLALDLDVAVKVIDTGSLDAAGVERTLREARWMARLDHPNLLRIFDACEAKHSLYLVLELMEGGSCSRMRMLPADRALAATRQLLSGLQALHEARIFHRDIKPANCLYRPRDGRFKLADLGIAADWMSVAANYDWAGTVPFMAPELFEKPPRYSPASDLYALGVTLACLLLGSNPFPAGNFDLLREWALRGERPRIANERPDLPPSLARLVDAMMSPTLNDRPANAAAALTWLVDANAPSGLSVGHQSASSDIDVRDQRDLSTLESFGTTTHPQRLGVWQLGEVTYSSPNWLGHVVTHIHTGKPARVMHLQPDGPIAGTSTAILAAAERSSRLSHPNLVEVIDWGLYDERAYVVTAAQGRILENLLYDGRPLEEPIAISFMAALADALAYLHQNRIVYQLVEPSIAVVSGDARNASLSWPIFCAEAGSPAYDDRGQSLRFIVPAYAAPEALFGSHVTIEPAIDLFGLGATFYHLLAGADVFFTARREMRLPDLRRLPSGITAPFARILRELVNDDPLHRPTAIEARNELQRIAKQLGIALCPDAE